MSHPIFMLTLHKTYYEKGFFNVGVEFEQYVSAVDCDMTLFLGSMRNEIPAVMTRKANLNGTPRIHGRIALRDWFFKEFSMKDLVQVQFLSPNQILLKSKED